MATKNSTGGVATSEGGGSSTGGAESGLGGATLKKGPWTAAEDAILVEYVRKHGEGNWNAVQRNSGLARCGKSCRLRWANHLRPNLKKGAFTPEEERLILELHAKYGNKWARMAAQVYIFPHSSSCVYNKFINRFTFYVCVCFSLFLFFLLIGFSLLAVFQFLFIFNLCLLP